MSELARVVQGLVLHEHSAPHYGVALSAARRRESHIRPVAQMLDRLLAHDDRPLSVARPIERRLVGVSFDLRGLWFIAGNLVRDVAAQNHMEMLAWDQWGAMPGPDEPLDAERLLLFDRLAALTRAPDAAFASCARSTRATTACACRREF